MYYMYILESLRNKSYYIGSTNDIERRVKEHNNGLSTYTRNKGPWKLCYKELFTTLPEARSREKQIKSWKKRKAIEKLIFAPIV